MPPPMTAIGLPLSAPLPNGRDNQSIAFFSTPGMLPLYSGRDHQGGVGLGGGGRAAP